uniref:Uncharacterized protein LOC100182421 n=1 Tax=Phallusia mammillata TaxID=59560 RepID=A0A6F9DI74_9ASCI|nr:uncharacterized protein LOC100182421 [Phallusia mammillata]
MTLKNTVEVAKSCSLVAFVASCLVTWHLYQFLSNQTLSYNQSATFDELNHMTEGFWRLSTPLNKTRKAELDEMFVRYWKHQKIPVKRWGENEKCGYYNFLDSVPHSSWPRVGSWCNPEGSHPCCNNYLNGTCGEVSNQTCNCSQCVDTRLYEHAELSNWITKDQSFSWNKYVGEDACQVIERSPFKDIYFIGDSFMRNMYTVLLMILANDFEKGPWTINMTNQQRELCVEMNTLFYPACRPLATNGQKLIQKSCVDKNFNVSFKWWPNNSNGRNFVKLVQNLSGKRGSLLLLGVGYHETILPAK